MTSDSIWTDDRIQQLIDCHAIGMSASKTAFQLGHGITRNSVIGKLNRLGFSTPRPEPTTPRVKYFEPKVAPIIKASVAPLQRAPVVVKPHLVPPVPTRLCTILTLTNKTCRWPLGNPRDKDFRFCGHPPKEKSPYCLYHHLHSIQDISCFKKRTFA